MFFFYDSNFIEFYIFIIQNQKYQKIPQHTAQSYVRVKPQNNNQTDKKNKINNNNNKIHK